MTALIAFSTLVALTLARIRRRRLRSGDDNLLLRVCNIDSLDFVILTVCRCDDFCLPRRLRFVLAWATASATTATRCELAARLIVDHACFGVSVARHRLSRFVLGARAALLRRLLARRLLLRSCLRRGFGSTFLLIATLSRSL